MSLRVRRDGRILCAAMHPAEPGDLYVDDRAHYWLSVERGYINTEAMFDPAGRGGHAVHGEWWWSWAVPDDVVPAPRPWLEVTT